MFLGNNVKAFVARDHTKLCKSFDGLCMLVKDSLELDPLSGYLFVFFNRRATMVKALYWDQNGFCIWQKRLEKGSFRKPSIVNPHWEITLQELQMLFSGIDVRHLPRPFNIEDHVVG